MAVLGQTFDGLHLRPFGVGSQDGTGEHREAVKENGADTAFSPVASQLGPGESQLFSEELSQSEVARDFDAGLDAVDFEIDRETSLTYLGQGIGFGPFA